MLKRMNLTSVAPCINGVESTAARPFWSVMVPTYEPRADYLKDTLKSVLQQDPGPGRMQIELVDDCSPDGAPVQLVREIAGDRVTVHQEAKNNGLAGIWNRCIERARGEWVHILHQDDIVLPGFYEHLYDGIVCNPDVGMAFSRFAIIDATGHWSGLGPLESPTPGVLHDWLERVGSGLRLECPAAVVKRATYERLGGFNPGLTSALDFEMWVRIAAHSRVYYEPQILAGYRWHGQNESALQERSGITMHEIARIIDMWKDYLPANSRAQLEQQGRRYWAGASLMLAQRFFSDGDIVACTNQLRAAKSLRNEGEYRSRRLRLEAKVLLHRVFGRHAISAVRALRRRIVPR
jgi:glycosyltransferase involved in cell wall biosynthesis